MIIFINSINTLFIINHFFQNPRLPIKQIIIYYYILHHITSPAVLSKFQTDGKI
jgi:hypothetical protein